MNASAIAFSFLSYIATHTISARTKSGRIAVLKNVDCISEKIKKSSINKKFFINLLSKNIHIAQAARVYGRLYYKFFIHIVL